MKIFENSTFHGTLGKKFFRKICPKTRSKHVWILLGTLLGIFGILKIFFFENFQRLDLPWKTGQNFFEKFAPKHVQNTFGYFWQLFWAFLEFCKDFFLKIFENSTLHGTLGKVFSKSLPQNMLKTRLDTFGNDFVHFRKFETFLIFLKIFEDSTFHGKLGKNFFRKNHPKTRLDTFGNTFGHFWNFENIFL